MRFSIIIPAYNAEMYIMTCLEAVKNQTYKDFEVLIIDDGSTDKTAEQIFQFKRENKSMFIKYIHQENQGCGKARSVGIKEAAGDYIAFLDSDDIWYPEKLERVNNVFKNNDKITVVYHDEMEIKLTGKKKLRIYRELKKPYLDDLVINGNALSTSTVVVESQLLKSSNLSIKWGKKTGDFECWVMLAKNGGEFYHLSESLGEYRRMPGSITIHSIDFYIEENEKILDAIDMIPRDNYPKGFIEELKHKEELLKEYRFGRYYHLHKEWGKAIECYKKSGEIKGGKSKIAILFAKIHVII